ncbi:MAG: hypothetical protein HOQ45_20300 [Nocardioidaceae bacterium]|nr:hypothetical protein [Nocardioidaceae bacterium]
MPTTRLNPQQLTSAGVTPTFTGMDLVNGNNYLPAAGRVLLFRNAGVGSVNVTVVTPGLVDGNPVADRVVSVPNGSVPFLVSLNEAAGYRSPTSGEVEFTAAAAVDVAVLQS